MDGRDVFLCSLSCFILILYPLDSSLHLLSWFLCVLSLFGVSGMGICRMASAAVVRLSVEMGLWWQPGLGIGQSVLTCSASACPFLSFPLFIFDL